jgi:DNA-binding NtrC family response regulator
MPGKYLSKDCLDRLLSNHWPGNVRELENTVQRGVLPSPDKEIRPGHMFSPAPTGEFESDADLHENPHMPFNEARAHLFKCFESVMG